MMSGFRKAVVATGAALVLWGVGLRAATPPSEALAVVRPADNPLAKPGGKVAVPTIVWESVEVRRDHPRLLFNNETKRELFERMQANRERFKKLREAAREGNPLANALLYQISGDTAFARNAIESLLRGRAGPAGYSRSAQYVFDWTFEAMTDQQRQQGMQRLWAGADVDRATGWPRCSPYTGYPDDPRPSETRPDQWPRFYNWTFHDQDWARRYAPTYFTLVAMAHHWPRAAEGVRNYWEYSLKDAVLFLDHLRDGSYWQGYYWAVTARIAEIYELLAITKSACGIDYLDPKTHPYLANFGRWVLYCSDVGSRRVVVNYGDGEPVGFGKRVYRALLASNTIARDPHVEWLMSQVAPKGADLVTECLFHSYTVERRRPTDLPPSRAFPGTGLAVLRAGWGSNDVLAAVRWADWFDMHVHPDVGSFILYCRSPLVPDSGYYGLGFYHMENYSTRTIAHNTLTIRDPAARIALNDGCQLKRNKRVWSWAIGRDAWVYNQQYFDRGDLLAFECRPLYSYAAGNGAKAYPQGMAKEFIRQTVLLKPGIFIVFDRVETPRPQLEKRWLMHLVGEPKVNGKLLRAEVKGHIEDYDGSLTISKGNKETRIRCHTLLPAPHRIRKVGGLIPNIPSTTLVRVPRTTQRLGTGSRWEWTEPVILYYNDPLTGKRLGAILIERDTPTDAVYQVTDTELYLRLNAYERGRVDEFRLRFSDYPTILDVAKHLGQKLAGWHTNVAYLPGYQCYNQGVNYAPATTFHGWMDTEKFAPELLGKPDDAGSWRIEVYTTKPSTRDYFLNVIQVLRAENDEKASVVLSKNDPTTAQAKITLAGKTYLVSFNKTGRPSGHIRIHQPDGSVAEDRDFATTIVQRD